MKKNKSCIDSWHSSAEGFSGRPILLHSIEEISTGDLIAELIARGLYVFASLNRSLRSVTLFRTSQQELPDDFVLRSVQQLQAEREPTKLTDSGKSSCLLAVAGSKVLAFPLGAKLEHQRLLLGVE
jgi:hypothetical protein